jgi:hypothetical protein
MRSSRFGTLLAHKPNRNEAESDLRKQNEFGFIVSGQPYFLVVDNWERPFALPTSPFLANPRLADKTTVNRCPSFSDPKSGLEALSHETTTDRNGLRKQ